MALELATIAATAVKFLSPFMPYLLDAAKSASEKLGEAIGEHGGEAVWEKAQTIWSKFTGRYGDDEEVNTAAKMVALKPTDENRQESLAEVLGERLKENPELAQEIFNLMGGQKGIQEVLAGENAFVQKIKQRMANSGGRQTVSGGKNSTIIDVDQQQ